MAWIGSRITRHRLDTLTLHGFYTVYILCKCGLAKVIKNKTKQHLSLLLHVFWGLAITYRANLRWLWASLLAQMVKNGAYNAGYLG